MLILSFGQPACYTPNAVLDASIVRLSHTLTPLDSVQKKTVKLPAKVTIYDNALKRWRDMTKQNILLAGVTWVHKANWRKPPVDIVASGCRHCKFCFQLLIESLCVAILNSRCFIVHFQFRNTHFRLVVFPHVPVQNTATRRAKTCFSDETLQNIRHWRKSPICVMLLFQTFFFLFTYSLYCVARQKSPSTCLAYPVFFRASVCYRLMGNCGMHLFWALFYRFCPSKSTPKEPKYVLGLPPFPSAHPSAMGYWRFSPRVFEPAFEASPLGRHALCIFSSLGRLASESAANSFCSSR